MKKVIFSLMAIMMINVTASAMSYSQAREQALFLTDKMAYELNLNDQQYEAAYEINLDYLMGINDYSDLYGVYWNRRNLDLSYILLDWQYRAYCAASYFYRPLYWQRGYWHFAIYARYPHRDYFYFGRPHFVAVYRGGHSWHNNGNRSWYHGRDFGRREARHATRSNGMRDRFDRGEFGKGTRDFGGRTNQHGNSATVRNNSGNHFFGGRTGQQANNIGTRIDAEKSNNSIGKLTERNNRGSATQNSLSGGRINRTDNNLSNQNSNDRQDNSLGKLANRNPNNSANKSGTFGNRMNNSIRSSTRTTVERRSSESRSSFGSRSNSTPSRAFSPHSNNSYQRSGSFSSGSRPSSSSMSGSRSGGSHSGGSRSGGGSFGGGHR